MQGFLSFQKEKKKLFCKGQMEIIDDFFRDVTFFKHQASLLM